MANYNLTDQTISSSFQQLLQKDTDTGNLVDGLGNPIDSLTISGSTTSDFFIGDGSQLTNIPHTEIPQGTVSGSSQVVLEDTTYTDNGLDSFLQTDGAGNLSFQYVQSVYETIRNMSGAPLAKGTPVYISGSTGDNGNAYVAIASDTTKMPATYVAGEDLGIGETGLALVSGKVSGVDTTGYPAGTMIYVGEAGGWSDTRPSGSNSVVQLLGVVQKEGNGGQGVLINQLEATLPNIQEGYAWVGDSGNQPVAIATSSFAGAVPVGVATTGSNTFNGDQTISGSVTIQDTNAPMSGLVLKNNAGGGDVQIIPAGDSVTTFNDATLTGITNYGGSTLSGSWGEAGNIGGVGVGVSSTSEPTVLKIGTYETFEASTTGETRIFGNTIKLQPSSSAGTSVQVTGDVTASVFSGTFVGDGSGLTLDSNIAYKNVSNTFTQAQNINGVTTINDETADSNFKIFTVQKNNDDILTLFNSSSANNNEGELTLKGGLNVISEQGQNKIFVEDAGGNTSIIGTDSIGIKAASDSIPFTQLTAGGVWGRSLDSDNNNTALWISGTPTKINSYGYQLNSAYNDTVGVYTARGPQFGSTPAIPMFYQYISSSAEYLAGDASIHFGTTITADEGFRTLPNILGGITPMEIFNSNGKKFEISAGALESQGQPAIKMFGFTEISGEFFANSLQSEPADANTPPLFVTDAIQPRLIVNSQNGATAEGWNIQLNGNINIPAGNIDLSGNNQVISNPQGPIVGGIIEAVNEAATPLLLVDTLEPNTGTDITLNGDTRIEGNTIVSGSLTLMPNVPIEATQVQANESIISPFIESQTGTFTIGSNTVISGSVQLMPNVPLVATQVQANEAVVTPEIESSTGTLTLVSNTTINGSNGAPGSTLTVKDGNNIPRLQVNNALLSGITGTDIVLNGNTLVGGNIAATGSLGIADNTFTITSGSNSIIFNPFVEGGANEAGVVFNAPNAYFNSTGNFNIQVGGIAATDANQIDLNSNTINSNGNHKVAGTNFAPASTLDVRDGNGVPRLQINNALLSGITGTDIVLNGNALVGGNLDFTAPGQVINIPNGTVEAGNANIGSIMNLAAQDPLPAGAVGDLAVSGSNLYFHNGTSWGQIN